MAEDWADNLPKLLPSWPDCGAHFFLQKKYCNRFAEARLPDYGGAGIDISTVENGSKCDILKHGIDQVHFGAQVCALPFFPYRKEYQVKDPCLEHTAKQYKEFQEFSAKLHQSRKKLNFNTYDAFRKDILTSHKLVKNMCLSGQFEKISLSQNIVKMANILPQTAEVSEINFHYSGGSLAALKKEDGSSILLHPVGSKLNKLAVTALTETNEPNRSFKPNESTKMTVKLKGGCIQQIKSTFNGYCYVKQGTRCHFVNFTNPSKVQHSKCIEQHVIKNISPSPYVPFEFISIQEGGKILLYDVEESTTLWESDHLFFPDKWLYRTPLACDFGSHPKSILFLDNEKVHAADLRLKNNNAVEIFTCRHTSCYTRESLLTMKRLSVNPFQHLLISNFHMFLCDERYPRKPVLIWNHLLNGSPLYCDISTYDTTSDSADVVILLGTQDTQELVSFAARTRQSHLQTVSLSPPLALSNMTDWADALRFHGQHIEESVLNRISKPLAGVCAVPHRNKPAFTAFQMTSVGDVFYQDFQKVSGSKEERTYRVDMGCILSPRERILPHVSEWIDSPVISEQEDGGSSACNLSREYVDLKDILSAPEEISSWCEMCKSISPNCDDKIVSSEICPSCGLDKLKSDKLHKGCNELDLFIGPLSESSDLQSFDNYEELSHFADHYSKKILDVWTCVEDPTEQDGTLQWEENSNFSLSTMSQASNTSAFSKPLRSFATPSQVDDPNFLPQQFSQSLFGDETLVDSQELLYTQQSMEEFIAPSQDLRPKIGETIRSSKKLKSFNKINTSSAGF